MRGGRARIWLAAAVALLIAGPGGAGDGVYAGRRLSDDDFFRLATCGAPAGGRCEMAPVLWAKRRLTVALIPPSPEFPAAMMPRLDAALNRALGEIRAVRSGIELVRDDTRQSRADITIQPVGLMEDDRAQGIDRVPNGTSIGAGYMHVWWDARHNITRATVLIAADIKPRDIRSILLEEMFQTLGFLFDIEGDYYNGRSILAQESNATVALRGQDRMLLLRAYPPLPDDTARLR